MVLAVAGGWFWHARGTRVLTDKDTIVLGDFDNFKGDPVFDGTLREGLSVQLEQSPFLGLVSEEGIHQTLRMMGEPAKCPTHAGNHAGSLSKDQQRDRSTRFDCPHW